MAKRPVPMPCNAQRLLGFLGLTGVEHPRDTVAGNLWPATVPERAIANLRTALWRVRRADPRIVCAGRDSIVLSGEVEIDYDVITSQARGIIAKLPVDDQAINGAARLLEADLLPGWDEEWLLLDRERHRQLRIHALERLSELLTLRGHYGRGPTRSSTAPRTPDEPHWQDGSTSTTTTGPTQPWAAFDPSAGWTTWLGITADMEWLPVKWQGEAPVPSDRGGRLVLRRSCGW